MNRCLRELGGLPATAVWDREGALCKPDGEPTDGFAAYLGQLALGWHFCEPRDPEAKGVVERLQGFIETSFEPGRRFANQLDFQEQLDAWSEKVNRRVHRTTRAVVAERLAAEHERMRPLPARLPDSERRWVTRVPPQPYLRFDRNDYSLDPRLVGRRVEVRAGQTEITAVALDTGELACRHRRVFGGGLAFTDPAHQAALEELRGERKRRRREPEVEVRPLARYDALIPA
jgi:Mu transposase, C-terminal domain